MESAKKELPSASVSGFGRDDVLAWPLEKWGEVVVREAEAVVLGILVGRAVEDDGFSLSGSDAADSE